MADDPYAGLVNFAPPAPAQGADPYAGRVSFTPPAPVASALPQQTSAVSPPPAVAPPAVQGATADPYANLVSFTPPQQSMGKSFMSYADESIGALKTGAQQLGRDIKDTVTGFGERYQAGTEAAQNFLPRSVSARAPLGGVFNAKVKSPVGEALQNAMVGSIGAEVP